MNAFLEVCKDAAVAGITGVAGIFSKPTLISFENNRKSSSKILTGAMVGKILKEKKIKKILIASVSGIGDIILTLPLCRAIKKEFPKSRVEVLTVDHRSTAQVAKLCSEIDGVVVWNKGEGIRTLIKKIRERKYDVFVAAYPSGAASAWL